MPVYLYKCLLCELEFEKLVRKIGSPPPICPECTEEMEQQVSPVSPFVWGRGGSWT